MKIRCYTDISKLRSIEERFEYLKLNGIVGKETWGWDRYFNQKFYYSQQWKRVRNLVIIRDDGCDLGIPGFEIHDKVVVHHMNPIWFDDLKNGKESILDPEFLICVSDLTHKAIHYGDKNLLPVVPVKRRHGDTNLW